MGRKKRKVAVAGIESSGATDIDTGGSHSNVIPPPPPPPPPTDPRLRPNTGHHQKQQNDLSAVINNDNPEVSSDSPDNTKKMSSGYATTSHSAEIIDEDIYVSDGSESDEDLMADKSHILSNESDNTTTNTNIAGRSIEMVLSGSKMGLMRRGIHRPQALVQPNRQWSRQPQDSTDEKNGNDGGEVSGEGIDENDDPTSAEERRKREEEEELAKLDPSQRAARLLAEKQRKIEEKKDKARTLESEENAGRDPCLFSKRTSFDIRFDQIDDKPWLRGAGDITDFFNYGFDEEEWLGYAERQLMIRQELIDANRQKRAPDPSIVPVTPKKPKTQNPRVAVCTIVPDATKEETQTDGTIGDDVNKQDNESSPTAIGPVRKKSKTDNNDVKSKTATMQGPIKKEAPSSDDLPDVKAGVGGAWGVPESVLAKLMEEQEMKRHNNIPKQNENNNFHQYQEATHDPSQSTGGANNYDNNSARSYYGNSGGGEGGSGYNDNQKDQQYGNQHDWNKHSSQKGDESRHNQRYQNHSGHDRNGSGSQNSNEWNSRNNDRGSTHHRNDGGRGGYRNNSRGGGGRRGGGDHGDGKGRSRGNGYGDRGGFQRRKRPREDYDDRYSRR